jgi:hypothetical protein
VDVCTLPMFDGISLIKWRSTMYPLQRVQSHLSLANGNGNAPRPRSIHRTSFENHRSSSRNSHELSRTSSPAYKRLEEDEAEEKDEFSYGFSNRRNSRDDEEEEPVKKSQFTHSVGTFESRNRYYD